MSSDHAIRTQHRLPATKIVWQIVSTRTQGYLPEVKTILLRRSCSHTCRGGPC
jgi:hypothetical protein